MQPQINIKLIFRSQYYYKEEFCDKYNFYVVLSHREDIKELFDYLLDEETISDCFFEYRSKISYYNKSSDDGYSYKPRKIK